MTEIICEYKECEFCKEGICTRDKIKVIQGAWDEDSCPVCVTGFWGEYVDYSEGYKRLDEWLKNKKKEVSK